ncbi:hypothetical protein ABFX02_08G052300 [Erythranthe guttata]
MGLAISRVGEIKILMVGLDSAGKTTIHYKLKLGEIITTIPIIGFNIETVDFKNVSFTVCDVGGQDRIIKKFDPHRDFQNTQGLILMVDSNDSERVPEAKDELHRMLDHSSCATSGQGLYEGLDWLSSNISN